jgi:diguanylate cyclase (GGDEF)-like protein/PAS domain S-box-containing protein
MSKEREDTYNSDPDLQSKNELSLTLTEKGFIMNPGAEVSSWLGFTPRELEGASFFSLLSEHDGENFRWLMEQVWKIRQPVRMDLQIQAKKGGTLQVTGVLAPDAVGLGLTLRLLTADVPYQQNSDGGAAVCCEDMKCILADAAFEGVLLSQYTDETWKIVSANQAACALTGYAEEDLMGKETAFLIAPEYRETMQAAAGEENTRTREVEIVTKTGTRIWVQVRCSYLEQDGEHLRVCALHDISEEIEIRQQLEKREEEFRALVEHSPDIIVRYNNKRQRIYLNPAFEQAFGQPKEQLLGKTVAETGALSGPAEPLEALIDQVFASGKPGEIIFEPDEKEAEKYYHTRMVPEKSLTGEVVSVLGVARDITAQKLAERALAEQKGQYQQFMENFHGIAFMGDGQFQTLFVGGAVEGITGYRAEDLLSKRLAWKDLIHPEDFPALQKQMERDRQKPAKLHKNQYRIIRKDKNVRWVEQHIRYLSEGDSSAFRTHGTIYDITERLAMEQALETSQKRYRMLVENITDVVYVLDDEFRIQYVSPSIRDLTGYEPEEMLGTRVQDSVWPEDREKVKENMRRKKNGDLIITEHRIMTRDGGFRFVRAASQPLAADSPFGAGLFGIMSDIHAERMVRVELAASETHFRTIVANIPGMFHRIDMQTATVVYVSDNSQTVMGRPVEELVGMSLEQFLALVAPVDRPRLDQVVEHTKQLPGPYQLDYRILLPDGTLRWVRDQGQGYWEDGKLQYIDSILTDITQQKAMEEDLRRSEALFRSLTENVPGAVYRMDPIDDAFVFLSSEFETITGYPAAFFLGDERRTYESIIFEEDREETIQKFNAAIAAGKEYNHEYRIVRADGSLRWVQGRARGYHENGTLQWVVGIITDIHERKETEARVEYLTFHDRMTGLYNRNFFDVEMKRLDVERMLPLSLIIGDVNGLKLVNDSLGHQVGDEMLILIARTIADACRQEDILCRWGGDEFAILLPCTWNRDAQEIMGRINERCAAIEDFPVPVSVSLGTASKTELDQDLEDVIREAEAMMYKTKHTEGKDFHTRVVYALQDYLHHRSDESPEHSLRVKNYSLRLARELDLSPEDERKLELLADLHDVGKLVVPEGVLIRPGPLTDDERILVEAHCEHGVKIIQAAANLVTVADEVLSHHEWYDGSGYPQGLKGEEIPLLARIFAVVDAYDVMTQGRAYRKALEPPQALVELQRQRGTQFDPALVDAFVQMLAKNGIAGA